MPVLEFPQGNLGWALEYIKRDWKIFPVFYVLKDGTCSCRKKLCKRIGKHPYTRNGVQDATSDEAIIRRWWTEAPYANIGLACGHNGLIVVDVDSGVDKKTGKPKTGPETLQNLVEANTMLPVTLIAETGSGGKHYYFFSKNEIKNSQDQVGRYIDVRGHGGYVILPPSNHEAGKKYHWATEVSIDIAYMPDWLENLCLTKNQQIDISVDVDRKQNEEIKKQLKDAKFSPAQLVKLLQFIPADCDRDVWWQVGAALKKEMGSEQGWKAWDEWSKQATSKYDSKTSKVQWESFTDKGISGGTIFHYAKEHGFKGFDAEAAATPEIQDNWLYAISIKRFVDVNEFTEWDREQFDANFSPLFERGKPSDHVLRNKEFKRVDGVTYWPSQEKFVQENGQYKLNYWQPSGIAAKAGKVDPFLNHVKYLFPDGPEADILLDYLAFQIQHPGEKIHWAILIEGDQGNGKSYFASVMRIVLGPHNVKMVHNEQLHETFTQWQRNTQLVVVEEMMARARLDLMNKLKPMITEPWCTIREMYRPPYEQANRFNFLFFSNHKDSIIIDNTDRRYCVLKTDAPPHPDGTEYYAPLFDWTRKNGASLLHYLANRPLGNFKPKAHAPMTAGKRALIGQSMLPLDQFINDSVEAMEYPCQWDLLTAAVLVKPLSEHNLRANPKEIANAFSRLGYFDLGRLQSGADKINIWAVRNKDLYREMKISQIRQVWLSQVNGTPKDPGVNVIDALYKDRGKNPVKDQEAM